MVGSRSRIIITLRLRRRNRLSRHCITHTSHNSNGIYVYASVYGISRVLGIYVTLFYGRPFYIHVWACVFIYTILYHTRFFFFYFFSPTLPRFLCMRLLFYFFPHIIYTVIAVSLEYNMCIIIYNMGKIYINICYGKSTNNGKS